ncbi:hypothetical protein ALC62_15613 [Cyphomyrmex costatus]|uniref:Uncharacterized protein n=1 Tax=Cyphomyrmex costatus TaxID=456900 RepID=A0A151I6S3_9HYME|nr:hypothetical protein ALC62_15613 [Cyphomyrmex costatus]
MGRGCERAVAVRERATGWWKSGRSQIGPRPDRGQRTPTRCGTRGCLSVRHRRGWRGSRATPRGWLRRLYGARGTARWSRPRVASTAAAAPLWLVHVYPLSGRCHSVSATRDGRRPCDRHGAAQHGPGPEVE